MPKEFEYLGFAKLAKEIGSDIFSLSFFGTTIIVLNSAQPAVDLFEKRSAIYSDRILPPALGEPSLMDWRNLVPFVSYTDLWRKYRRMMHIWLGKQAIPAFYLSQQHQARLLLQRLLEKSSSLGTSEELDLEFFRTTAATMLRSVYGYDLQSVDDPFLSGIKEVVDHIAKAAQPSRAGWKKTLREWRKQKETVVKGVNNVSIVASLLGEVDKWGQNETEASLCIQEAAIALFGGGTDTTANTLAVFVLAMLLFPTTQSKAQQEIDTVVGTDRLPAMEDQASLPYVGRLIQEVLRWQPVTPLGVPHVCAEENEYRGYRFPRGAIVFGNIWYPLAVLDVKPVLIHAKEARGWKVGNL
ncbi:hypothetical protein FRC06_003044 [Ceratobasidium sp. 370]|nr:hypothetical protein FRC06_003044 [Ceratobasidium sp. 370]